MLSSLFRPSRSRQRHHRRERSPFSSTHTSPTATRRNTDQTRLAADEEGSDLSHETEVSEDEDDDEDEQTEELDEDGVNDGTPLLPIFSAAHLDALPVYNITHDIRLLIISRCETTLSWDQLRSPQVSQFLLKPIQQEIRASHFSSATECALMANCLQFTKEISLHPGNSGTSKTRAMVCELIAIKLLKEFTTRELIDALSYDFDPLHGQAPQNQGPQTPMTNGTKKPGKPQPRAARISCLEIALRAQAKRFLAHPLVVQQLEAIWAGTIVFHSAADNMHRRAAARQLSLEYGSIQLPASKQDESSGALVLRRSVTLYDPRDASLFKLSRLRVPRYRNLLSTLSFAVLLGLFLAVLTQKSVRITTLEVVFWFWSAGYMLDELVGFNEQGFSLYLASFWNTFDLGILILLIIHLCLRIYGIVMSDAEKSKVANMAYDVLAADAVLLFPRLFSVLDHYRYFSQLLIAFRMMASDLVAIFVLIIISCSGFFVALTLSFGNNETDTPGGVAYALLQMLLGYTPAAWDRWEGYNALGKTILTLFLFICHFLVVTILITVLTNSFMAIVQNANEEHQFLFAVNTISMVKSDALFSYVAPTNIIAWIVTPLRYFMPFRRYVKVNRTIIKVTHFPILFSIFVYEKVILSRELADRVEPVEPRGRSKRPGKHLHKRLAREPSVATYRQDRALEEVFRRPYESTVRDPQKSPERRKTSNVVSNWMRQMDPGVISPPQEQDRTIVDRLENRRTFHRKSQPHGRIRDFTSATRSVASDPEDFISNNDFFIPPSRPIDSAMTTPSNVDDVVQHTDADGDDELVTNDNEEEDKITLGPITSVEPLLMSNFVPPTKQQDYFFRQHTPQNRTPEIPGSPNPLGQVVDYPRNNSNGSQHQPKSRRESPSRVKRRAETHLRNVSAATIVYDPGQGPINEGPLSLVHKLSPKSKPKSSDSQSPVRMSGALTPSSKPTSTVAGRRTPKKTNTQAGSTKARPVLLTKDNAAFRSTPNLAGLMMKNTSSKFHDRRRPSIGLGSDIGDNKAAGGGFVPASFATQMAYATGGLRRPRVEEEDQDRLGRLMLVRMNNLEEGFREVVHEMRDALQRTDSYRNSRSTSRNRSNLQSGRHTRQHSRKRDELAKEQSKFNQKAQERRERLVPLTPIHRAKSQGASDGEWVDDDDEPKTAKFGTSL